MPDPLYQPQDFLNAETLVDYIGKNLAIRFQTNGATMTAAEAREHFKNREAVIRMRKLLIDEAERVHRHGA